MPFYSLSSSGGLVEAATYAALPATGATGTLYVVTATNTLYRWSGSDYVEVSASITEIVEGANLAAFPATGAAGKIYVALDTGKAYRWGGSTYVEVSPVAAHAASHASGGSDAVTLAVSQVTGLQTALDAKASSTDSRLSDSRAPTGAAGGDLAGTFPNPTLAASGATAGTYKSVTVDAKGRVTAGTNPTTLAGYGITDAAASTHTHAASAITSGTIDAARLPAGVWQGYTQSGNSTVDTNLTVSGSLNVNSSVGIDGSVFIDNNLDITGSLILGTVLNQTYVQSTLGGANLSDDVSYLQTQLQNFDADNISNGTVGAQYLGSGTASASTYLHGNNTWGAIDADHVSSGNLSASRLPVGTPGYAGIADADDWASRVSTAGGSVSSSTMAAVYRFCIAISAAGLRDRFWRLNLFCGNYTAAMVPLYRGPSLSGTQYGGTTDSPSSFTSSDYTETGTTAGGLQGDGSSKWISTGLAVSAIPDLSTGHLAAYCTSGFTGSIGGVVTAWNTGFGDPIYMIEANRNGAGNLYYSWGSNYQPPGVASGGSNGFFVGSRVSSTSTSGYRNGLALQTNTTAVTPASISTTFAVFRNNNPTAGANYFSGRIGGYSIGRGVYGSQVADMYRAWQSFQSDLGRAVW